MQVASLAKSLQTRGWKVSVISMLPEGNTLATELRACGANVATLRMQKGKADPRAIWRLAKMIRALKPDVLHAHMVAANLLARLTRLFAAVPLLVSTAHSIREGGWLHDLAYRATDHLGDVSTNVSNAAATRYACDGLVPETRLRVLRNGIDVNLFRPSGESRDQLRETLGVQNQFVWIAIGRFREEKDYPNMLKAFAGLTETVLLIAGEGELRSQLEQTAAALQVGDRVRFLGFREDSSELLNAADGYVLSSRWEGLPLVLLEAAATGIPIVATNVGGNAEVVLHSKTGFLVPAANSSALRDAMRDVMALSVVQRHEMGLAGREFVVSNYSMAHIVNQWETLYREFLDKREVADKSNSEVSNATSK